MTMEYFDHVTSASNFVQIEFRCHNTEPSAPGLGQWVDGLYRYILGVYGTSSSIDTNSVSDHVQVVPVSLAPFPTHSPSEQPTDYPSQQPTPLPTQNCNTVHVSGSEYYNGFYCQESSYN